MNPLTAHEVEEVAALRRSPRDIDCLPLQMQVVFFARYLIHRGGTLFSADDIALLFRHADMTLPRSGKPNQPTSATVAKHIETAVRKGELSLLPGDAPGEWCAPAPDYVLEVTFELKAQDRFQAKDQVLRLPILGNRRVVSDQVDVAGDAWRVDMVLRMCYSGTVAARNELLSSLQTLGTRWEIRLRPDGGVEGESRRLSVTRFTLCRFTMRKHEPQ